MIDESAILQLNVRNFRGLREAAWSPAGVCTLVGPNSSGKSTLLEAFLFAHYAAKRTPKDAINVSGGMRAFLHQPPLLEAADEDPSLAKIEFSLQLGRACWRLTFSATNDNVNAQWDERIVIDGETWAGGASGTLDMPTQLSMVARKATWWMERREPNAEQLADRIGNLSLYRPWELQRFRKQPWSDPTVDDLRLSPSGGNIFAVLQNWRDTRENSWRYDWVIEHLKRIHSRSVGGIELRKGGGALSATFYAPSEETEMPIAAASNGILATLFALTAVAGAEPHGLILLDEPDNGLHPSAIRALIEAFRSLHESRDVHIVMATHSPIILNAFNDNPEDVWVTEHKRGATYPIRLTDLCDPEWLANFRVGNIYGTGFGRQDPLSGSDE